MDMAIRWGSLSRGTKGKMGTVLNKSRPKTSIGMFPLGSCSIHLELLIPEFKIFK